ncbi:hypothetical protein J4G02_20275 [Candidatus Poribacteria bacterium]|nr:hypothetical protein [Candidatus Poribacteria bacterium]
MARQRLEIVAGLSLRNLKPRVWDGTSPFHLPALKEVMVSWADLNRMPSIRRKAMREGLHKALDIPPSVSIYLDNGAFNFAMSGGEVSRKDYEEFVLRAKPDWYVIPQDYIPAPRMTDKEQLDCLERTMEVNLAYSHDGYVPIIHISRRLDSYIERLKASEILNRKSVVALGGIVPNLLRMPKAMAYDEVLDMIRRTRAEFSDKRIHVFGIGGTATLHIAALMGIDSVDSSGWRNRAARGIVQLQGCGDRLVAQLGKWRGRKPSDEEHKQLSECQCPSCLEFGIEGLAESGIEGFSKRASHNLWTLLEESRLIDSHISNGTYACWYRDHLNNSIYRPLVDSVVKFDDALLS